MQRKELSGKNLFLFVFPFRAGGDLIGSRGKCRKQSKRQWISSLFLQFLPTLSAVFFFSIQALFSFPYRFYSPSHISQTTSGKRITLLPTNKN
jgi:hypothetical protein